MEATEVWSSRNLTNSINRSGDRDIFLQRQMGPHCIVVPGIRPQHPLEMRLSKDDRVVETFSAYRPNDPLNVSVLPWRSRRCWTVPDSHRVNPIFKGCAVARISVTQQISRRTLPGKGLGDLPALPVLDRFRTADVPASWAAQVPLSAVTPP